jgi:gamma-glutamyltranspeptidase/glutathione hydrolase
MDFMRINRFVSRLFLAAFGVLLIGQLAVAEPAGVFAGSAKDQKGAVATVDPRASAAALAVLEDGGNAIDAAVAAALTLGVVDSHNSGLGGGNFTLVHWADGRIEALDGREVAPVKAHRDMYLRDGKAVPELSKTGALAIGVPGSLAAYDYLLAAGGSRSLAALLNNAAELAEAGVAVSPVMAKRLQRSAEKLAMFPASSKIFLDKDQQPLAEGEIFKQADLANTYRQIAKQGIGYFYGGPFAEQLDAWMKANGGIVSAEDFRNYRLLKRKPVTSHYRDYQIIGFPPPSSGGVHVAQILNILQHFELAKMGESQRYHVLAEAMKRAFADRAHYLGDPDFVKVPKGLIDPSYAGLLAKTIDLNQAGDDVSYGLPPNADIDFFGKHTTHIATADKLGNWVAITTTVNTSFGSKVVIPGTGVVMNNQMDDFVSQPGVPNAFGLVGNEANSVAAGKRPLSSMSPTLVLKDGQPVMTLGAAGGPTIISQVVQALVNVIDLQMSVNDALVAQRVHHQWKPPMLLVENTIPESLAKGLEGLGHQLYRRGHFGATQMIRWDGKRFEAVTEPRIRDAKPVAAP